MQELNLSRGYLSSVSPRIHFGLGDTTSVEEVIVEWPDGNQNKLDNIQSNTYNKIAYNGISTMITRREEEQSNAKQFETVTQKEPFIHLENQYDDFKDEVLLPHKNSTLGPALAVGDLNNDGREDYIIGGAIAQAASLYIQQENGIFQKVSVPIFEKDKFY